ncbi:hypothetical protein [Microcoleus sp. FACHB-831]|uniref:hypothetical protein n=1 Tax=Microcoleus sp. FACHB-831 TaxID=2692827 RepID=UPI001A7E37FE|nr:hypothetical protein [Microcoleus sp. FACHB-831]
MISQLRPGTTGLLFVSCLLLTFPPSRKGRSRLIVSLLSIANNLHCRWEGNDRLYGHPDAIVRAYKIQHWLKQRTYL